MNSSGQEPEVVQQVLWHNESFQPHGCLPLRTPGHGTDRSPDNRSGTSEHRGVSPGSKTSDFWHRVEGGRSCPDQLAFLRDGRGSFGTPYWLGCDTLAPGSRRRWSVSDTFPITHIPGLYVHLSLTRANAGHIYGWGVLHQVDECPDYRPRGDSIVISKPSTISPPHVDRHEIPSVQEPVVGRKGCSRQLSGCRIWYGVVTFRARGLISLAVPAS